MAVELIPFIGLCHSLNPLVIGHAGAGRARLRLACRKEARRRRNKPAHDERQEAQPPQ